MVDFSRTADDYAQHRAGFPDSLFAALEAQGLLRPGLRALDLGTGTGSLARAGAQVTGLDIARDMLDEARVKDRAAGVEINYLVAAAEQTGQAENSFDLVTAGQCWHWFERRQAAAEVCRILKPGGALLIAHFDWLPLPGNVVAASEKLIKQHNPNWRMDGMNGIHGQWLSDLRHAGLSNVRSFSYDEPVLYSRRAWRGRIRASAGVAASLSPDQVTAFDDEHAALLAGEFPDDLLSVPHAVFVAHGRTTARR